MILDMLLWSFWNKGFEIWVEGICNCKVQYFFTGHYRGFERSEEHKAMWWCTMYAIVWNIRYEVLPQHLLWEKVGSLWCSAMTCSERSQWEVCRETGMSCLVDVFCLAFYFWFFFDQEILSSIFYTYLHSCYSNSSYSEKERERERERSIIAQKWNISHLVVDIL